MHVKQLSRWCMVPLDSLFSLDVAAASLQRPAPIEPQRTEADGTTPLHWAGALNATRVLLEAGASVNDILTDGTSALVLAVASTHHELAVFLLDHGADPNVAAQGWTAWHQIAWTRRPNVGLNNPGPVQRSLLTAEGL